jgi:hypothetical protein
MRVRHMQLEQYLFFRDVGLAGQLRDGTVDRSFRGLSPHRSRAAVELALLTGMRLGECVGAEQQVGLPAPELR